MNLTVNPLEPKEVYEKQFKTIMGEWYGYPVEISFEVIDTDLGIFHTHF